MVDYANHPPLGSVRQQIPTDIIESNSDEHLCFSNFRVVVCDQRMNFRPQVGFRCGYPFVDRQISQPTEHRSARVILRRLSNTWPEHGALCLVIFSCSQKIHPQTAIDHIAEIIQARKIDQRHIVRGDLLD